MVDNSKYWIFMFRSMFLRTQQTVTALSIVLQTVLKMKVKMMVELSQHHHLNLLQGKPMLIEMVAVVEDHPFLKSQNPQNKINLEAEKRAVVNLADQNQHRPEESLLLQQGESLLKELQCQRRRKRNLEKPLLVLAHLWRNVLKYVQENMVQKYLLHVSKHVGNVANKNNNHRKVILFILVLASYNLFQSFNLFLYCRFICFLSFCSKRF